MRLMLLSFLGQIVSGCIRVLKLGAGSTWPGELALAADPDFFGHLPLKNKKIIIVAGTNGKTTTVKLIKTVLKQRKFHVTHNASGANLLNGIATVFLNDLNWRGKLKSDYYILEVDENALAKCLAHLTPDILILLNLFRDQLDRYGEVDTVAALWQDTLQSGEGRFKSKTTLILNADDPHIAHIASTLKIPQLYFGLENPALYTRFTDHATDSLYCPKCGNRLTYAGYYFSHLGKYSCGRCGFTHPEPKVTSKTYASPLEGIYNIYNTMAAGLACDQSGIQTAEIASGLAAYTPAFGRQETMKHHGINLKIVLSKNPTGFNQSLRTVGASQNPGSLLLVLNDRIPDGTDVSWIWDVDFEILKDHQHPIVISGDRAADLGVRIKYALDLGKLTAASGTADGASEIRHQQEKVKPEYRVISDLAAALGAAENQTRPGELLWILPTYSAMLEVRKLLTGKKIL